MFGRLFARELLEPQIVYISGSVVGGPIKAHWIMYTVKFQSPRVLVEIDEPEQ